VTKSDEDPHGWEEGLADPHRLTSDWSFSKTTRLQEIGDMKDVERAPAIRGKTIRFIWTDGPTRGKTHEHVFHQDGTVTWSDPDASKTAQPAGSPATANAKEQPAYAATRVADKIYLVSYLAPSGYTLTVALNFDDQQLVGFASGAKEWYPVRGIFQVVK
jgi:hypothetical protein